MEDFTTPTEAMLQAFERVFSANPEERSRRSAEAMVLSVFLDEETVELCYRAAKNNHLNKGEEE